MRDFKKLGVWKRSHQLSIHIYGVTNNFPKSELSGLTSQVRRAIASVPTKVVADILLKS